MSERFDGARVTVLGLGRFGGGAGVARWMADQGAHVLVSDLAPAGELETALASLGSRVAEGRIALELGGHSIESCTSCDVLVVNPAVPRPWSDPFICAARTAGVRLVTEIGLVVERLDGRNVVGVTGTAGKSTTAAMIHHLLGDAAATEGRRAHFGGNVGGTLLERLGEIGRRDHVVLELSSAMLHWLGETADGDRAFAPRVAVLTNLVPNHLDWHESFAHYAASKAVIFRHQREGDLALRPDDPLPTFDVELPIPGAHNVRNARTALAAAQAMNESVRPESLAGFRGLPHRLAPVDAGPASIEVFDDSKSTTPEATHLAVDAFPDPARVHLICGGYDKGVDLAPIVDVARRVGGLYAIGATGDALARDAAAAGTAAEDCRTLDRAVDRALDRIAPGEVLLLSPGCASWDQFPNYEERGRAFVELVRHRTRSRARPPADHP